MSGQRSGSSLTAHLGGIKGPGGIISGVVVPMHLIMVHPRGARNSCSPLLVTIVSMQQLPPLLLLKLILLEVCFAGSSVILWPPVLDLSVADAREMPQVALPRCH